MLSLRLQVIGLNLLILLQFTQSFVLLTANIEDLKKFARKFFSEPLAEKLVEFIATASGNIVSNVSEENEENAKNVQKVSDDENEIDAFKKAARQLPTSKRYKMLPRHSTSFMPYNKPGKFITPGSQENLRHKQNHQIKVPNSKIQIDSEMAKDRIKSVYKGKPLAVVNQDQSIYYKKPQEKQYQSFFWEKKPVERQKDFNSDNQERVKQPIWKPKRPEWERLKSYLDPKKENDKQKKRKLNYERMKHSYDLRNQPKLTHPATDVKPRPPATKSKPRQPAIEVKPRQVPHGANNIQKHNVMPMADYHPKAKQHVLMNIKPPGRSGSVFKIERNEFGDEETTVRQKSTSGYSEAFDRALYALRERVKPRSNRQTFALLNAKEEPYVIPPIKTIFDINKTTLTEEIKPTMKIEFVDAVAPHKRANPEDVRELTTQKEKNDFDQYDLVSNHTPGSVVATAGPVVLRRESQDWWKKEIPVAKAIK